MTTHITKTWFDGDKVVTQEIHESEVYKQEPDANEVLRVTADGQFVWNPDADRMIEEGDFSFSPALPHILRALRKREARETNA
jgi:hypothetical protein